MQTMSTVVEVDDGVHTKTKPVVEIQAEIEVEDQGRDTCAADRLV